MLTIRVCIETFKESFLEGSLSSNLRVWLFDYLFKGYWCFIIFVGGGRRYLDVNRCLESTINVFCHSYIPERFCLFYQGFIFLLVYFTIVIPIQRIFMLFVFAYLTTAKLTPRLIAILILVLAGSTSFVVGLGSDYISGSLDDVRCTFPWCLCLTWVKSAG